MAGKEVKKLDKNLVEAPTAVGRPMSSRVKLDKTSSSFFKGRKMSRNIKTIKSSTKTDRRPDSAEDDEQVDSNAVTK